MPRQKASIFISYSWNESDKVDLIEEKFKKVGIKITRDVNDLKYKDDLPTFMSSVRKHDYCLILLSDSYLKSPNCLTELLEFSKEDDFSDRILPIYHGVDIFNHSNRIHFIKYWEEYSKNAQEELETVKPIKSTNEIKLAQKIEFISLNISDFLESIQKLKILSFKECKDTNFQEIFEFLDIDENHIKSKLLELDKIQNLEIREAKLEELFIEYPENDSIIFYKGCMASVERKNPAQAVILFEKYLKQNPDDILALNNLAFQYNKLKKPEKALELLSTALELEPQNILLQKKMGILLFLISREYPRLKNYQKSIFYLEKAAKGKPDDQNIFFTLGEVYLQGLLDFDKALDKYQKSLELKPDQLMPYIQSVSILIDKARYDDAKNLIQEARIYFPENEKLICSEAMLQIESGVNIPKGIDQLKKLTLDYPKFFMPYIQLSKYFVEYYEDYESAISILLRGQKIVNEKEYVSMFLANLIEKKGKDKERSLYNKLIECLTKENYSKAETLIKKHESELNDKHTAIIYAIYNNWGLQLVDIAEQDIPKLNMFKKACRKFEKATEIYSDDFRAWGNWGLTLGKISQASDEKEKVLESVFEKLDKATQINPNVFEIWLDWGNYLSIYSDLKNTKTEEIQYLEEACDKFEMATKLEPSNFLAFYNWGKAIGTLAYIKKSKEKSLPLYKSSIDKLNRSIELQPDNYHAWSLLGLANMELAEWYEKEKSNDPTKYFKLASEAFIKSYELSIDDELKIEISKCLFKASFTSKNTAESDKLKKRAIVYLKRAIKDEDIFQTIKTNKSWEEIIMDEAVKKIIK